MDLSNRGGFVNLYLALLQEGILLLAAPIMYTGKFAFVVMVVLPLVNVGGALSAAVATLTLAKAQ